MNQDQNRAQVVRKASVGESREARMAGYSPAAAPITSAAAMPPNIAAGGMITSHPCNREYPAVAAAPRAIPPAPPTALSNRAR